jgi:hypothetical protein
VAVWGVWFAGIAANDGGLGWEPELWGGALVWSGLAMLALGLLLVPQPVPGEPTLPVPGQPATATAPGSVPVPVSAPTPAPGTTEPR